MLPLVQELPSRIIIRDLQRMKDSAQNIAIFIFDIAASSILESPSREGGSEMHKRRVEFVEKIMRDYGGRCLSPEPVWHLSLSLSLSLSLFISVPFLDE